MTDDRWQPRPTRRRGKGLRVIVPVLFFLLGLAAMAWALTRWDAGASYLGLRDSPAQQKAELAPRQVVTVAPPPPVSAAEQDWGRIEQLEQRLSQIEAQSRTAGGNVDRAEGLLVAFAVRRALDRGVPLGYLEPLLIQRFGRTHRAAVATLIRASREPVTLEELREELREVAPDLAGGNPGQNWWAALQTELSDLVTIRREGTPSPLPEARLDRAVRRLEAGQVDVALAEVLRLPGREKAADWITDARRYVTARRALDMIETASLSESHAAAQEIAAQPRSAR